MAAYDPKIKAWVNQRGGNTTLIRRKMISQWANEGLDSGRQLTRKMVKYWFGGCIWAIAKRFGQVLIPKIKYGPAGPMTAGDILNLFHAWAQDCSQQRSVNRRDVRDEDLASLQLESWRRAITPYRKQWDHIISGG